jgi:hypothetical protein
MHWIDRGARIHHNLLDYRDVEGGQIGVSGGSDG